MEPIKEVIKVVSGNPTPEELAAVIAILEAAHAEQVSKAKHLAKKPTSSWNRSASKLRSTITPGLSQWSAKYRPSID